MLITFFISLKVALQTPLAPCNTDDQDIFIHKKTHKTDDKWPIKDSEIFHLIDACLVHYWYHRLRVFSWQMSWLCLKLCFQAPSLAQDNRNMSPRKMRQGLRNVDEMQVFPPYLMMFKIPFQSQWLVSWRQSGPEMETGLMDIDRLIKSHTMQCNVGTLGDLWTTM